jgi:hypothetical protein
MMTGKPSSAGTLLLKQYMLPLLCISSIVGIALKFLTFQILLNENLTQGNLLTEVIFPYFPNVLDSLCLIVASIILLIRRR